MRYIVLLLAITVTSCAVVPESGKERVTFVPVSFSELPGWQSDSLNDTHDAFLRSCAAISSKPGWKSVCVAAKKSSAGSAARKFFETNFTAYAVIGRNGDKGLFTGYYLPELHGSLRREGPYQTPLYERPADLVTADLGLFKSDLKGQKISGKVEKGKFIPYDKRKDIAIGSLAPRAKPLVWIDDPIDAFFLEVQGSGRVRLTNGTLLPVGYDGANGRPYTSIGRELADKGELERPVTMASIRAWLARHPEKAQEILNLNESYVFFRPLPSTDVPGAQGVALTPLRSLAVDPHFLPLGTPVWLDTTDGKGAPFQRLMIAQDTGGAIKGAVRGDVYWGAGKEAAHQAGSMQSQGRAFALFPKTINPNAD